jgi:short-subunit dehydrogenase
MNTWLVVTGGTKGIGKAIVEKFASKGFNIITCARHSKELKQLSAEITSKYKNSKLLTFKADLSDKEETKAFITFIKEQKISVEVLINNTGTYIPGQIHKEKDGVLEQMIETNLYSAYRLSRGLVTGMIKKKQGYIFNICSTASIMPYVNGGSYCISKYALYGMTKVLREELKEYNIKVTAVLPGATKTASWDGVDLPDERFIKPADVAESIFSIYTLSPNTDVEEILIRPQLGDII